MMMPLTVLFVLWAISLHHATADLRVRPPPALIANVTKDSTTLQYALHLYQKSPLKPQNLVLDLGASFLWADCYRHYRSSSFVNIPCSAPLCATANSLACRNCFGPPGPDCANDTCGLFPENSIIRQAGLNNAMTDVIALSATDGRNPGRVVGMPNFLFSCARPKLLNGLATSADGMAAFGRSNVSLPVQLADYFNYPMQFAMCLPSSPALRGVVIVGKPPAYSFLPDVDASRLLAYTPLIVNPYGDTIITYIHQPSSEYFINVITIKVNGKEISANATLLRMDKVGHGGARFSTVVPYTALESSIYQALEDDFVREAAAMNIARVAAVKPFSACLSTSSVTSTRVGLAVPEIDFVLDGGAIWKIFGANSMVRVSDEIMCLGFVDGGSNLRTPIVIGGHQLEDNLLEFDLVASRVGLTSSLLFYQSSCSNFNFTFNSGF